MQHWYPPVLTPFEVEHFAGMSIEKLLCAAVLQDRAELQRRQVTSGDR